MKDKPVPALEVGLTLVEMVAAAGPRGSTFTALLAAGFPKASLARQLQTLTGRGWLVKAERGAYVLGLMAIGLVARGDPAERVRIAAAPLLPELMIAAGNTALAVAWSGMSLVGVAKAVSDDGVTMQEVGTVTIDLGSRPWGWFTAELTGAPPVWPDAAAREHFLAHGVAWDAGVRPPCVRRLAAPILVGGTLFGAIALGGTLQSMPDGMLPELTARVLAVARAVAARLGG